MKIFHLATSARQYCAFIGARRLELTRSQLPTAKRSQKPEARIITSSNHHRHHHHQHSDQSFVSANPTFQCRTAESQLGTVSFLSPTVSCRRSSLVGHVASGSPRTPVPTVLLCVGPLCCVVLVSACTFTAQDMMIT